MQKYFEIAKDLTQDATIGAGAIVTFFAKFDNYAFKLLQVTDFNLGLNDALDVWESIIRTTIGILTIIGLYYRIKFLKKKHE